MSAFESQVSMAFKYGNQPTAKATYHAIQAPLRTDAIADVRAVCPASMFVGGALLRIETLDGHETAPEVWDVDVNYSLWALNENDWSYSFDFTGGTQHITSAKEHIADIVDAGEAEGNYQHGGLINVDKDGNVHGLDMVIPVAKFHIQFAMPAILVTDAYKRTLLQLIGKTNNALYKGALKGELLLTGVQGKLSKRNPEVFDISYQWAFEQDAPEFTIGTLPTTHKEGWHYVWTETEQITSPAGGRLTSKLRAYHVERIYDYADFSLLGLGTT